MIIAVFNAFERKAPIASQNPACILSQCAAGILTVFPAPPLAVRFRKQSIRIGNASQLSIE